MSLQDLTPAHPADLTSLHPPWPHCSLISLRPVELFAAFAHVATSTWKALPLGLYVAGPFLLNKVVPHLLHPGFVKLVQF